MKNTETFSVSFGIRTILPLIEYRMCVHVFGNAPSPAVATYGMSKTVAKSDPDVKLFVSRDFCVDDGVTSVPLAQQAVGLMKRTQRDLRNYGKLRLCKVASADRNVLNAFPVEDLCEELQSIDIGDPSVPLPVHNCLGLFDQSDIDQHALYSQRGPFYSEWHLRPSGVPGA